jgi:hypothetical protein
MGPFEGERGTVQSDGYILSDLGKLIHPANVSNGEVNKPKEVQAKSQLIQVRAIWLKQMTTYNCYRKH